MWLLLNVVLLMRKSGLGCHDWQARCGSSPSGSWPMCTRGTWTRTAELMKRVNSAWWGKFLQESADYDGEIYWLIDWLIEWLIWELMWFLRLKFMWNMQCISYMLICVTEPCDMSLIDPIRSQNDMKETWWRKLMLVKRKCVDSCESSQRPDLLF